MNQEGKNLRINGDRLWDSIMEMAKIGPGVAGGNNRQTLTDDDAKGRDLFKKWCEKEGLEMGLDTMGNMFARRQGSDPNALPVMVGSHLDTQPTGGKYDGVLGVLGVYFFVTVLGVADAVFATSVFNVLSFLLKSVNDFGSCTSFGCVFLKAFLSIALTFI